MGIKSLKILFFSIFLLACSNDSIDSEKVKNILIEKESTLTAQEKVRELLIITEGNYSQLACIFNCSPSSLKRIYKGETFATPEAEIEINKHYNYFIVRNNQIDDFKADCISYKWYNYVKSFMANWWFWIVILTLIYILAQHKDTEGLWVFLLFICLLIFVIVYVINFFGGTPSFNDIPDNFINTMDTIWESKL